MSPSPRDTPKQTARPGVRTGGPKTHRVLGAAVAALVLGLSLSSCAAANDSLAQQAEEGDNKNYVAGDGSVTEYSAALRGAPIVLDVPMMDGTQLTSADLRGKVAVLNFWYAACAPCRLEAPTLESLHQEFTSKGVVFNGVNIRDEAPTGEAFERSFGISYPSVLDKSGTVLLALSQYVPPQAVPTTLVIDKQGRVAARILGVAEKSTLKALLTDAIAEPA
ncbi:TlpA family protein disulfide reductase [Pseudarthrobacter raffinosi]|uniref:TlpA family protein disulfide reductase n=1 Tax=Pseudarthrobacter raffinosi TaxID=2953651 RepID=UPI0035ABE105